MISFMKILFLIWIIAGLVALVIGTKYMHNSTNRKALHDHIKEIAEELKLKEEDCISIMYVGFVVLGFVGGAIALFKRLKKYTRRGK